MLGIVIFNAHNGAGTLLSIHKFYFFKCHCESYCTVLWKFLYSTMKVIVRYYGNYCTVLWKLLYIIVEVIVWFSPLTRSNCMLEVCQRSSVWLNELATSKKQVPHHDTITTKHLPLAKKSKLLIIELKLEEKNVLKHLELTSRVLLNLTEDFLYLIIVHVVGHFESVDNAVPIHIFVSVGFIFT